MVMWSKIVGFWCRKSLNFVLPDERVASSAEEQLASNSLVHIRKMGGGRKSAFFHFLACHIAEKPFLQALFLK